MRQLSITILFLATCVFGYAQHHWENGDTETLWRQRYGNCDYGMFMVLPDGLVGHSTLPPAPNHGFAIRLPDVSSTDQLDLEKQPRYLWVNAEYNASDDPSWRATIEYYVGLHTEGKHATITKKVTKLRSLRAIRVKITYKTQNKPVVEEVVFAKRAGIVYEIGVRTTQQDYAEDTSWFEQLLGGFRLSRLSNGECSNG